MRHYDFLIIGGGLAAATAVKELLRLEPKGKIGVLAEENVAPYDRPPLSKDFLLGDLSREAIFLLNEDFCRAHGVDLLLANPAAAVDTAGHAVTAADGSRLTYGKLLIASGCQLRRLSIPGSNLPGLFYLRTLAEAEALRAAALEAGQAVVIGGGFIGLEVASVLAQLGMSVSIIHQADRLMEKFASEEISSFIEELFFSRGVHVVYEDEAVRLLGDKQVDGVATKAGRTLPCDLAVAGIGVRPDTSYLEGSGLEINNGVVVNGRLEAGAPDVYAAGDIANFHDVVYGKQRRIEHWDNAIRQGKLAAGNMAGGLEEFRHVSYFYSTVFGLTYECLGDMTDFDEVVTRGSLEDKSATVLYLKQGVLQSAFMLGRPFDERTAIEELITGRRRLDAVVSRLGS
jgi:NADPH-dependent 2,4-dienoyl-CoA reductase/sulfur reductase-like enzyme